MRFLIEPNKIGVRGDLIIYHFATVDIIWKNALCNTSGLTALGSFYTYLMCNGRGDL